MLVLSIIFNLILVLTYMKTSQAFLPFTLPNGSVVKNRLVKAAMEENMANKSQQPGQALFQLYESWATGGVGVIITGNVMVDRHAMTGPGGVVLERNTDLTAFTQWAKSATKHNTRVWMQINHPGRQVFKAMKGKVLAPSKVPLNMGKHSHLFGDPKAMNEAEILDVIERFTDTAKQAQKAGFHGVEVHAAHGYLLSQFLSPLTNKRTDKWGGSLENRSRLLITIVKNIREACGTSFDLSVKLNSADFQRGGFDIEDAKTVVSFLTPYHIDLIELSGGSYEAPAMQGRSADQRTLAREAYFLEFASYIAEHSQIPIMTTGGIKKLSVVEKVLSNNIALVGMATALAYAPTLPNIWHEDPTKIGFIPNLVWQNKVLRGLAVMALVKRQLKRIGQGKMPKEKSSAIVSLIIDQWRKSALTRRYLKYVKGVKK